MSGKSPREVKVSAGEGKAITKRPFQADGAGSEPIIPANAGHAYWQQFAAYVPLGQHES
jgi:hypothetical protein